MIKYCEVKDKRILELGSLDGDDTSALIIMGAKEVIGIEGKKVNYDNCCNRKIARSNFIYANIEDYDLASLGYFDLCIASGILYHFMNPSNIIEKLSKITNSVYVCCRYPLKDIWFKEFIQDEVIDINGYKGKEIIEFNSRVSGLGKYSIWLYKDELIRAFKDFGFRNINIKEEFIETKYGNINTGYIIFIASKKVVISG